MDVGDTCKLKLVVLTSGILNPGSRTVLPFLICDGSRDCESGAPECLMPYAERRSCRINTVIKQYERIPLPDVNPKLE